MTTPAPVDVNMTTSPNYMEQVRVVNFNPALAAVVLAMILSIFAIGFAIGYFKKCIRPVEVDREEQFVRRRSRARTSRGRTSKSEGGLDSEVLKALPRVQYKDLPADERLRKYFDCPVCLAPFEDNDTLRLLPVCSHAFHSDCIDEWFLSHSTCPLCRASSALPKKASGEERGSNAEGGEQVEVRVLDGFDVVEVVIGGHAEHGRNETTDTAGFLQAPMANYSAAEREEQVNGHPSIRSTAVGSFKPAVRVVTAPEKAAVLASIRRSNSAESALLLLHPSYVVDSEGTQHNRNDQTHSIDVGEFLLNDYYGAHYRPPESSSRLFAKIGNSSVTQQISK